MSKKWLKNASEAQREREKFNRAPEPPPLVYRCAIPSCDQESVDRIPEGWLVVYDGNETLSYCAGAHAIAGHWQFFFTHWEGESAAEYDERCKAEGAPVDVVDQHWFVERKIKAAGFRDDRRLHDTTPRELPPMERVPTRDETPDEKNEAHLPDYERERGTAELHDRAFRARCGIIGRLMSCVCAWPDVVEPTSSGHHPACPAARVPESQERFPHAFDGDVGGPCVVCSDLASAHQHHAVDARHLWFCPSHRLPDTEANCECGR